MEWIVGGLIAALVGTAMQSYASASAQRKAQAKMNAANYALGSAQDRINDKIMQAAGEYQSDKRVNNQQEEADRIATDIKTDVTESQAIRDAQQETAGNVSSDYERAREASKQKTQEHANAFADLVGTIRSAGTNRMNEGFKLNRYAQDIGMLAKNAQGDYAVNVAKAQDALHSKDGLMNLGKIVSAIGTVASMYGGLASAGVGAAGSAASSAGTEGLVSGLSAAGGSGLSSGLAASGATLGGGATAGSTLGSSLLASAPGGFSKAAQIMGTAGMNGGLMPYLAGGTALGTYSNPWKFAK